MPNGIKKPKLPRGYRAYRAISRFRYPTVATLSPKGYKYSPIRAYEIALGLKPRKWIRQIRARHRAIMGMVTTTRGR